MHNGLGCDIPKLGFGMMRLPMRGEEVDIEQTKLMADRFIDSGFTYFDTAYGYIEGLSERAVKPVLTERYERDRYLLATKLSLWAVKDNDFEAFFKEQLEHTGASYFDFYLLHNVEGSRVKEYEERGVWDFLKGLKERGLVRHIGFSFHSTADVLDEILAAHPEVEFVQLQLNYIDWESEGVQSRRCYEVARKHGRNVIVMEPVKGGALALLPESVQKVFKAVNPGRSMASWALRFVASLDGIITVLSGMSDIEQMSDNLATMTDFEPLNADEITAIEVAAQILKDTPTVPCTACKYCLDNCPLKIPTPAIIRGPYNNYKVYANLATAKNSYRFNTSEKSKASECLSCGLCEANCPQKIGIMKILKESAELFES